MSPAAAARNTICSAGSSGSKSRSARRGGAAGPGAVSVTTVPARLRAAIERCSRSSMRATRRCRMEVRSFLARPRCASSEAHDRCIL